MHLEFTPFALPMRVRFRGITVREGMVVNGGLTTAEVSPFWDYGIAESARWLKAGIETATQDYPEPVRSQIPVNVTIPAVSAEQAYALAVASGAHTAKVKIAEQGQSHSEDVERIRAVADALPGVRIRVDVNGKWDLGMALARIPDLDRAAGGLEYVEQPCMATADLAAIRRALNVPIAADESIRRAADPFEVVRLEAADVAVIKNQPLGGVRRALELVESLGLPAVVSSALESSVGLRAGLALAAALPELNYACGLGTASMFDADTIAPILASGGWIELAEPTPSSHDIPRPSAGSSVRWQERLGEMWAYLEARGDIPVGLTYSFQA